MSMTRRLGSGEGVESSSSAVTSRPEPLVIAITGASGAAYGVAALELCNKLTDIETHLIISRGARSTIQSELGISVREVASLADVVYPDNDLGAAIASGSYLTRGMLVAPCSIKSLSAIAQSYADTLITRAADVTLKERRPLVLMVRETPFHKGHLRLMSEAADSGAVIFPPVPAMYIEPRSVDDLVDHSTRRALEHLGVMLPGTQRWAGLNSRNHD